MEPGAGSSTSFLTRSELEAIGFKSLGADVLLSRKVSLYNPSVISIGDNVRIDDFCVLSGGEVISIGSHVHIGCYSALFGAAGIILEDFVTVSVRVAIFSASDDASGLSMVNPTIPERFKPTFQRGRVTLKRHSGVGVNSTILPGVTLEEGAILVSHSRAARDCKAWTLHAGCPALELRPRSMAVLELERQFLDDYHARRSPA
jgi:acetyltransferase-like isoleucine patch superfamily enzyme